MKLDTYCWKVYKDTLLHSYYLLIDDHFSLANILCIRYGLKIKFIERYTKPETNYSIYIVRVRKKDQCAFEQIMWELPELMRKADHHDYESFCKEISDDFEKEHLKPYAN